MHRVLPRRNLTVGGPDQGGTRPRKGKGHILQCHRRNQVLLQKSDQSNPWIDRTNGGGSSRWPTRNELHLLPSTFPPGEDNT